MNKIKPVDFCDSDGIMQVNADTSNQKDMVTSSLQTPVSNQTKIVMSSFWGSIGMNEFCYDLTELMSYVNSLPDTKRSRLS